MNERMDEVKSKAGIRKQCSLKENVFFIFFIPFILYILVRMMYEFQAALAISLLNEIKN